MEELDLKELLQIFWGKKLEIILVTAIFVVIGLIYTMGFVIPQYEGTTKLLLATNSSTGTTGAESITSTDVTINSKLVSTYSELVRGSNKIIRQVISNLGLDPEQEEKIRNNTSVTDITDTEVIKITVKDEDPVLAAKIANEMAKVFISSIKEFYGMENVHVVDEAEVAEVPCNINHAKDIMIFAAVGIVVAFAYVLISNMLDTTIKSAEDIEKMTGLTVIATIPIYDVVEEKGKGKRKGGKR